MTDTTPSPLGAVLRGVLAGAVGTLAMDLVWYARYRRDGGDESFLEWEFSTSTDSFDEASAPAKAGRRIAEGVFDEDLPEETAGPMNNVMHWATGLGYGAGHGLLFGSTRPRVSHGLVTGPAAFANSYTVLPLMGLYEPLWEYDAGTIYKDLSAHVAFGLATAAAFRALTGSTDAEG
ncbi:MAG: hypothetical protein KY469_19825 [Actinobacteria bacterium]|nr:hypothetical protein [Actinomycetota bacterium]